MSSVLIDELILATWRAAHEEALEGVPLPYDDRTRGAACNYKRGSSRARKISKLKRHMYAYRARKIFLHDIFKMTQPGIIELFSSVA